ncbi:hypothetical protein EGW08_008029 [Elysia chlorotica]|uniref:PiggyBac transposable element-derived protein domain-containing protein n=1 Tax=Elysia chlorotica TaxID=188477 RepID=A0A3S1BHR4_ELYCH|nr:hypothetical protein EGW08_008029 [Elysia chlorotica]
MDTGLGVPGLGDDEEITETSGLIEPRETDDLVSLLTDSASYMRGCHNGFQAKLKEDAPHLVDIDGDVCHHLHNIAKCFTEELNAKTLIGFIDDVFNDLSYSADLKADLHTIAETLNLSTLSPLERVPHRWLSILDTTERLMKISDQLTVFYYAWLSKEDKVLYKERVTSIVKKVGKNERASIFSILKRLKVKNLTAAGRERKKRIIEKLFFKRTEVNLMMNTISNVLPLFKSFILKFEQKEPMIHKLYDAMEDTMTSFFARFLKIECIKDKKLHRIDVDDKENHLSIKKINTGANVQAILDQMNSEDRDSFLVRLQGAYIKAGAYMQNKLPLKNKFLKCLSALDPLARGHSLSATESNRKATQFFQTHQNFGRRSIFPDLDCNQPRGDEEIHWIDPFTRPCQETTMAPVLVKRSPDLHTYVYSGKDYPIVNLDNQVPHDCTDMIITSNTSIALLLQSFLNKGYHLYVDNWYSSVSLLQYLHKQKTLCTSTAKANRVPKELKNQRIAKGQSCAISKGPLLAQKFEDKNDSLHADYRKQRNHH